MRLQLVNVWGSSSDKASSFEGIHAEASKLGINSVTSRAETQPTWLLIGPPTDDEEFVGTLTVITGEFSHQASKDLCAAAMRGIVQKFGIVRYSFISEIWATKIKPDDKNPTMPSKLPPDQRDDMLMVMSSDRDTNRTKVSKWLIMGTGKKRTLGPEQYEEFDSNDLQGRMMDLFHEEQPVDYERAPNSNPHKEEDGPIRRS